MSDITLSTDSELLDSFAALLRADEYGDDMDADEDSGVGCYPCDVGGVLHQHWIGEHCNREDASRVRDEILRRMAAGTVRDAVDEFSAGLYDSNYETRGGPALEPGDIEVTPVPPEIQAEIERILREKGLLK